MQMVHVLIQARRNASHASAEDQHKMSGSRKTFNAAWRRNSGGKKNQKKNRSRPSARMFS
jgi:hypothetical protein